MTCTKFEEVEYDAWSQAIDVLVDNIEQFRVEAAEACRIFTPLDRKLVKRLETKDLDGYDFFNRWYAQVRIQYRHLHKPIGATFVRTISQNLEFSAQRAEEVASRLIQERENELAEEFITDIYGSKLRKTQRTTIEDMLTWNEKDIEDFRSRYIRYEIYTQIAVKNRVTIYDPHLSWLKRRTSIKRIRSERAHTIRGIEKRVAEINRQLEILYRQNEGLIHKILATKIDIVTIIVARTEYEKQLQELPKSVRANPVTKANLYAEVAAPLRDSYGKQLKTPFSGSLSDARQIVSDIDQVLVKVFDLSNSEKNKLMTDMKSVRDLSKEKEAIQSKRQKQLVVSKRALWH